MDVKEIKSQLSGLCTGHRGPYTGPERERIARLYAEVFARPVRACNCPDKWRDAITEIYSFIKHNGKMTRKSTYKLRAGVVLQLAGSSQVYTNDNLTDEIAKAFLEAHPNAAGRFEVIPTPGGAAADLDAKSSASGHEAAIARIAELESENERLKARIAELEGVGAAPVEVAEDGAESDFAMNAAVKQTIAEELAAGRSKSAIKKALAGQEIDGVKLTHRLVEAYIDELTAEE